MAGGAARGEPGMIHCRGQERGGAGMAGFTGSRSRNMRRRFGFHPGKLTAVAVRTPRSDAGMIHGPGGKGSRIEVASFTSCRRYDMPGSRLAQRRSSIMAGGTTRRDTGVIKGCENETGGAGMTRFAGGSRRNMRCDLGFHPGKLPAVTARATRSDTAMVHRPRRERCRAGMAGFARRRGHNMTRCRFAQCGITVMAGSASRGNAGVIKSRPEEAGGIGMAGFARSRGHNVCRGFGFHPNILTAMTT